MRWLFVLLTLTLSSCDRAETNATANSPATGPAPQSVDIISPLIDPDKLDTLTGKRAATPQLRKVCYWLRVSEREISLARDRHQIAFLILEDQEDSSVLHSDPQN